MNIHTTPQTVGTHNNTHQYINMAKRQLPIGQPFRVYTSHTYSRHRPHRNLPAVEGPRRGGSQTYVFSNMGREDKASRVLVWVWVPGCARIMLFLHSQQEFPSMCCCFDLCGHSFQYKSCPTMFRMRQLARYAHWGGNSDWGT